MPIPPRPAVLIWAIWAIAAAWPSAQDHAHTPPGSGIPHGIPRLCLDASLTSVRNGAWSDPATWSASRVPERGERVRVGQGTTVTFDIEATSALSCVDVDGALQFRTDRPTRLIVGTLTVLEGGRLDIGTIAQPVAPGVTAEVVIADQGLDLTRDPEQFGTGIIGLGTIRIAGSGPAAPFVRLAREPRRGDTTLLLDVDATGWSPGDTLVLPDSRHLRHGERGDGYAPQSEEIRIATVTGRTVTLAQPLAFDHPGARTPDGNVEFLPHAGNLTRNVVIRSENPRGTRGHTIFVERADIDIRHARFTDLGRTRMGVLDSTERDAQGTIRRVGTNQIGRYAVHFHHAFGPRQPQPGAPQFAFIGNVVDQAAKWGIAVHNSHYGLVQGNVVFGAKGAAIVTEDGTESFNRIVGNFALRSEGSGDFAPRSGYGGASNDPGGEGAGFWLRGPNNVVRDNVAASADTFGFGLAAGSIGRARLPLFPGADTSRTGEYREVDSADLALLDFTGNEAYGAMQAGVAVGWNGRMTDTTVWHVSRHAVTAFPVDELIVDRLVARGDTKVLASTSEAPVGLWFANYASKSVTLRRSDIQGLRVGVASPFVARHDTEQGRGDGTATIEASFFRNDVGVAVATAYSVAAAAAPKRAIVRSSTFAALPGSPRESEPPVAISMNHGMASGDREPREPLLVYDLNNVPGQSFRLYYSLDLPADTHPCAGGAHPALAGFVCAGAQTGQPGPAGPLTQTP